MNKAELIAKVKPANASNAVTEGIIDALGKVVQEALAKGEEVTLPGIGKLSVKERPARTGRNPRTGEAVQIEAKKAPAFSASKALKDALNA
jgi:DNA-binding protein HU-beta